MNLLLFYLAYFVLAFLLRSWLTYRRTGINPYVLPASDDAYGYVANAFKALIAVILLLALIHAFLPDWEAVLGPITLLQTRALHALSWLLLMVSMIMVTMAQAQMGASWRIGIDTNQTTELVQGGLFKCSRNPIFLAMKINLLGLLLAVPSALSLAVFVAGEVLMQVQVRLEEKHLLALHGDQYLAYQSNVPRWL